MKKHTYKSENTWASFFAHRFFKYQKKHTYESQNTLFHTNNNFKGNNLHKNHRILTICIKNHYTNNSHKNHRRLFEEFNKDYYKPKVIN